MFYVLRSRKPTGHRQCRTHRAPEQKGQPNFGLPKQLRLSRARKGYGIPLVKASGTSLSFMRLLCSPDDIRSIFPVFWRRAHTIRSVRATNSSCPPGESGALADGAARIRHAQINCGTFLAAPSSFCPRDKGAFHGSAESAFRLLSRPVVGAPSAPDCPLCLLVLHTY